MTDNDRSALLAVRNKIRAAKETCRDQFKFKTIADPQVIEEINRIGNDCIANMLSIDALLKGKDVSDQPPTC